MASFMCRVSSMAEGRVSMACHQRMDNGKRTKRARTNGLTGGVDIRGLYLRVSRDSKPSEDGFCPSLKMLNYREIRAFFGAPNGIFWQIRGLGAPRFQCVSRC